MTWVITKRWVTWRFRWKMSTGKLYLPGLKSTIRSAAVVEGGKSHRLRYRQSKGWTVLEVPAKCPNPLATVIELKLRTDAPEVDRMQGLDPEKGLENLSVKFTRLDKCSCSKSSWMEKFGEWKHAYRVGNLHQGGTITWIIHVKEPGYYQVALTARGNGRAVWQVESDEGCLVQNQQGVSSIFVSRPLGWLEFKSSGTHTLTLSMPEGGIPLEITSISLTPVVIS